MKHNILVCFLKIFQKSLIILTTLLLCSLLFGRCTKDEITPNDPDLDVSEYKHLRVIFHVIHNGQPVGTNPNVAAQKISAHIEKINAIFQAMEIRVQFVLAKNSPDGQTLSEPGIERIYRPDSVHAASGFFQESWVFNSMWNPNEYINIWVCKNDEDKSFATLPYVPKSHPLEGMISTDYYLSNPPSYAEGIQLYPSSLSSSTGRVITHEMGHFLGLQHVFEGGCAGTDYCEDTYHYDKSGPQVNYTITNCSGNSIEKNNYMDYAPLPSQLQFTKQQIARINFSLAHAYHRPKSDSPNGRILHSNAKSDLSIQPPIIYECE